MTSGSLKTLSVLYIHTTGAFGGASKSLFEMLTGLIALNVSPNILLPKGRAFDASLSITNRVVSLRGVPQFDNTKFGHYRYLRWLILLRELYYMPFMFIALLNAKRSWSEIKLIHVNEITALLPAILAKLVFRVPLILHVRSVQAKPEITPLRSKVIYFLVSRYVDSLIAIDETVRSSLPESMRVNVVHNGFSIDSFNEVANNPEIKEKQRFRVAIVGGLLELKGIFDFLESAKISVMKGLDIEFMIVGENARQLKGIKAFILKKMGFYRDVRKECEYFIQENSLQKNISMLRFVEDVSKVYRSIDVLCFPSHLNATGRPVFEAAFFHVPSIVAIENSLPDTFKPHETGLAIPQKNPQALADAIEYFYRNPKEIERMGRNAYELAIKNFDSQRNAEKVLDIYRDVLSKCVS
ncbi:MAG: glycosyltransferase family 4 protein [Bdellovibrionales bacterium]|nr:glycosyltransferase family 4 protein [Bdellovibrionales bacterium]